MTDWDRTIRGDGPAVFATAWHLLGDAVAAADVVEEVFAEALASGKGGLVLRRWAACRALERLRQRNGHPAGDAASRLRLALTRIPEREATVFALRHFDGLSCAEITEACALSPEAVAAALRQAHDRLESLLHEMACAG